MPMPLNDYRSAVRFHRAIRAIMRRVIEEERPQYRYGVVTDIQPGAGECRVILGGDTTESIISISHVRPVVGDKVRVAGRKADRYIAAIVSPNAGYQRAVPGVVWLWPTVSAPDGWLFCDGSVVTIVSYPNLFTALGITFGGDGVTTFGLPNLTAPTGVKYIVKY